MRDCRVNQDSKRLDGLLKMFLSKMNLFLLVLGTELRTFLHAKANPLPLSPSPRSFEEKAHLSLLNCRVLVKYVPCKCESLSVEPIFMEKIQV